MKKVHVATAMKRIKNSGDFEVLSPLEGDVLNVLWPDRQMRVRDIYKLLRKERKSR